jgi:cysteine dioxygenase
MKKYRIEDVVGGLCSIRDADFSVDNVYTYLSDTPVDVDSISRYLFWNREFYTRNLVYKDERFEMLVICWERGQASAVHDHSDQKCWMTVPVGRLQGQNFKIEEIDESRSFCKLKETQNFELSDCLAAKVELEEPIHQVLNLAEYDERAVSIHIYSKPYDHCRSFCRETNTFSTVQLSYNSISGEICRR